MKEKGKKSKSFSEKHMLVRPVPAGWDKKVAFKQKPGRLRWRNQKKGNFPLAPFGSKNRNKMEGSCETRGPQKIFEADKKSAVGEIHLPNRPIVSKSGPS